MKLNITNGDCAGSMLNKAHDVVGDVLCWRDLLHDGPLSADIQVQRKSRIKFLSDFVQVAEAQVDNPQLRISKDFAERDDVLSQVAKYDEVILWFEHDLYDQLQLLEISHQLLQLEVTLPELSIICIDDHPSVPVFHGLGNLTPETLGDLFSHRVPLTVSSLQVAQELWLAITAKTPQKLSEIVAHEIPGWPYMAKALRRFCCEYPALETGLTLTQTYLLLALLKAPDELPALEAQLKIVEQLERTASESTAEQRYYEILTGPATFRRIFHHLQQLEVDPFMGDLSIKRELKRLSSARVPYIEVTGDGDQAIYRLTVAGAELLQGRRQWHVDNGVDLWRGGVHVTQENLWMWDQQDQQFVFNC